MSATDEAYQICEDIIDDPNENDVAQSYAQAALDQRMSGDALDVQMNYVASNASQRYKKRIARWQGVASTQGYEFGYCQVCGDRDAENAYYGQDEAARGLVCVGCYEDFGGPDECEDCGAVTYEGDTFVRGEREGEFYCNSCLTSL